MPDRGVRVADGLGVKVGDRDLEELGEHLGIVHQPLDPAVGVVQNHQVRRAAPGLTASSLLAQLGEQLPRAQDRRRDAAADVAHHDRLTEVETENITRVDPGIDATDDPQRLIAWER